MDRKDSLMYDKQRYENNKEKICQQQKAYRDRNKAKIAKKNAIISYLEAKNIKKTYMLESLNDSDSDFDAEIDEVSESELEGLQNLEYFQ